MKAHPLLKFVASVSARKLFNRFMSRPTPKLERPVSFASATEDTQKISGQARAIPPFSAGRRKAPGERRELIRSNDQAQIFSEELGRNIPVIESSHGGARVVLPAGTQAGDLLSLRLQCGAQSMNINAKVAWISKLGSSSVVAGIGF